MILKVCGMRDPENIRNLVRIKPDWMGLIFYSKSSRWVENHIPSTPSIMRVGVFADSPLQEIIPIARSYDLDMVQLHGNETPETCQAVRNEGYKVIKAFAIFNGFDFSRLKSYQLCDYFLFDTRGPLPGGNSFSFDWELLKSYDGDVPFLLSGGIGPESVSRIKDFSHPKWIGIDVNSRFEISPGMKDIVMLKVFKDAVFG
jgi:phosphoribosylanthranilate isomerase